MLYDGDTFEHNGNTFRFRIKADDTCEAPWEREESHGPVSDWTSRDKAPGELVLNSDRSSKRYYDFAEACRIARKDGWGFLPGDLKTEKNESGQWRAYVGARFMQPASFHSAWHDDINAAIREVYALYRATFPSARAYAAGAAMRDFQGLKDWCDDQWSYVGVIVNLVDDYGDDMEDTHSLWGIESDSHEYLEEVARELAEECQAANTPVAA